MADREDLIADHREFTREMLGRFDQVIRGIRADTREHRAETRSLREEMREEMRKQREETRAYFQAVREENRLYFERFDKKLDEVIAENRAQRQALFRMLDRLDNGGGAATA